MKRALALAVGLLAAALALFVLLRRDAAPSDEDIDDASREALENVLKQEEP